MKDGHVKDRLTRIANELRGLQRVAEMELGETHPVSRGIRQVVEAELAPLLDGRGQGSGTGDR